MLGLLNTSPDTLLTSLFLAQECLIAIVLELLWIIYCHKTVLMRCWFSKHGKEHYMYAATDSFSAESRPNFEKRYLKSWFFLFLLGKEVKLRLQSCFFTVCKREINQTMQITPFNISYVLRGDCYSNFLRHQPKFENTVFVEKWYFWGKCETFWVVKSPFNRSRHRSKT